MISVLCWFVWHYFYLDVLQVIFRRTTTTTGRTTGRTDGWTEDDDDGDDGKMSKIHLKYVPIYRKIHRIRIRYPNNNLLYEIPPTCQHAFQQKLIFQQKNKWIQKDENKLNNPKIKLLFCIVYNFHNSYFVIFVQFVIYVYFVYFVYHVRIH